MAKTNSKKINILIVYNQYQYHGGEDTYFDNIVRLLKSKGHRVFLYTEDSKTIGSSLFKKIQAAYKLFYNPALPHILDSFIGKNTIDAALVLNIYPLIGNSLYWELKRRKITIIQRIANYRYLCPKTSLFRDGKICEECPLTMSLIPSVMHSCYQNSKVASIIFALSLHFHKLLGSFNFIHAYIFPSDFVAKKHNVYGAIPKKKTHIVPTFYDSLAFNTKSGLNRIGIVYAGRLVIEKGVMFLLEAASYIPEIPITIVGEGPLKNEVVKYAKKYKHVTYIPFLDKKHLLSLISRHRALVLPALWYDVLPNIVLEAYSTNTPVIAPRHGVFQTIIKNNKTGFLYRYGDIHSFVTVVKKIAQWKVNPAIYITKECKRYYSQSHYKKIVKLFDSIKK